MAAYFAHYVALSDAMAGRLGGSDDQALACCIDDGGRDLGQVIDAQSAFDLRKETAKKAEVAASDPDNGGDGVLIGDAVVGQGLPISGQLSASRWQISSARKGRKAWTKPTRE